MAEIILHSIRIEVRCRTIHYLDAAFRHVGVYVQWMHLLTVLIQGNYQVDHEAGEPDPYIVDLNSELSYLDEFTSTTLLKNEQKSVKLSHPNHCP